MCWGNFLMFLAWGEEHLRPSGWKQSILTEKCCGIASWEPQLKGVVLHCALSNEMRCTQSSCLQISASWKICLRQNVENFSGSSSPCERARLAGNLIFHQKKGEKGPKLSIAVRVFVFKALITAWCSWKLSQTILEVKEELNLSCMSETVQQSRLQSSPDVPGHSMFHF